MKNPQSKAAPASKGGTLAKQLETLVAGISPKEPTRRLTHRQKTALESLRRYVCGELGVKAAQVEDRHVATLLLKIDWGFTYRNHFYIGHGTLQEMQVWATDLLAGREVAQ